MDQLREVLWYSRKVNTGINVFIDKYTTQKDVLENEVQQLEEDIIKLRAVIKTAPSQELTDQLNKAEDSKKTRNEALDTAKTDIGNAKAAEKIALEIIQIQLKKSLRQHAGAVNNYASAIKIIGGEE